MKNNLKVLRAERDWSQKENKFPVQENKFITIKTPKTVGK